MDVDTPPRPSFPASATATTNPFGFSAAPSAPPVAGEPHPLAFDASAFRPEQAFGLESEEISMADGEIAEQVEELKREDAEAEKENLALVAPGSNGARRRKTGSGGGRKVSSSSRSGRGGVTIESEDESSASADEGMDGGFLSVLKSKVGRGAAGDGAGQFSFQVHHHHAPAAFGASGAVGGFVGALQQEEAGWRRKGTPGVLLGYLQFTSLALLAVLVLSLSLLFLYTLYHDIRARLASLTVSLRAEIMQCAKSYVDNRCAPETRIPAMEAACGAWEECMNREVVVGGKTRVVAETLAEVVNGFVEVISLKTMLFTLLTLFLTIYGSSLLITLLPPRPAPPPSSPTAVPSFNPHAYGAPPGYPPYGLPYGGGGLNPGWTVENGAPGAAGERLGLGAPEGGRA
ncbi:hypothetical protein JCM10213v2_004017 [Rhodosporidiobolus nylandii]